MAQALDLPVPSVALAELQPIVAQILGWTHVDVTEWRVRQMAGVAGSVGQGGRGLFRIQGLATDQGQEADPAWASCLSWSVVVKVFSGVSGPGAPGDTTGIPTAVDDWQREILAYRSGMLAEIHGSLVAPRCYAVTEHPDHEWRVWLEDVAATSKAWLPARYGISCQAA